MKSAGKQNIPLSVQGRDPQETEKEYKSFLDRMRREEENIKAASSEDGKAKILEPLAKRLLRLYELYESEKKRKGT